MRVPHPVDADDLLGGRRTEAMQSRTSSSRQLHELYRHNLRDRRHVKQLGRRYAKDWHLKARRCPKSVRAPCIKRTAIALHPLLVPYIEADAVRKEERPVKEVGLAERTGERRHLVIEAHHTVFAPWLPLEVTAV